MKVCCEEMKVLLTSLRIKKDRLKSIRFFEDGEEAELAVVDEVEPLDNCINVLFRFCPYCGTCLTEVKDTGVSFLDELKAKLFPKELNEKTSLSCRTVQLEETLEALQKFFTNEAPKFAKKIQQ